MLRAHPPSHDHAESLENDPRPDRGGSCWPVSGDVRARAQNGPIGVVLAGSSWQGAGLDAETRNGPISLSIPAGSSAPRSAAVGARCG